MKTVAIDIGTTAIKFVLYNQQGEQLTACQQRLTSYFGDNGAAYQWVEEIKQGIRQGIRQLCAGTITTCRIVLSTPMHTVIPLENQQFKQIFLWSDTQASQVAARLKDTPKGLDYYQRTGTPIHPMSPLCKLCFFQEVNEQWYHQITQWADLKAVLMQWLTERWVTDYSSASASGLFNSQTMEWDAAILADVQLTAKQLPDLVEPTTWFTLSPACAEDFQLTHCQVMIGASDGCFASYAALYGGGTRATLTIGTSGAFRLLVNQRLIDPLGRFFCYYLTANHWVIGGPTNNGGKVLDWLSRVYLTSETAIYQQLPTILAQTVPGARGVSFYPYLLGERAPFWDGQLTARFVGLDWRHEKADLIRAGVEGILFHLRLIGSLLPINKQPIAISGGFFQLPELRQLAADSLNSPLLITSYNEPSDGAFLFSQAIQTIPSLNTAKFIYPDNEVSLVYDALFEKFIKGLPITEKK